MLWLRDIAYGIGAVLLAPVWALRMIRAGKHRTDWRARFGHTHLTPTDRPTILIHAVSVGEVNATRLLVRQLTARYRDDVRLVISATTDTGIARARQLYETRHEVVRYPLDFSRCVRRFLDQIRPELVVLVELEVWPNFAALCRERGIPIMVANGRLSARSFARYLWAARLVRPMFRSLAQVAAQDEQYAERFIGLGTPADRVAVVGTMKWDNAVIGDSVEGAEELAEALGLRRDRPLIVCGSTGPGEERLFVERLASLEADGGPVQLLIAPRKPERFDEAATAMGDPVRRTEHPDGTSREPDDRRLFLLDTLGELRKAYALADLVVVGRSFSAQFGSDMMEPIALGKPTIVGPNTADFAETVRKLREDEGIVQVADADELVDAARRLLRTDVGAQLAAHGRAVIEREQGATARHVALIEALLDESLTASDRWPGA